MLTVALGSTPIAPQAFRKVASVNSFHFVLSRRKDTGLMLSAYAKPLMASGGVRLPELRLALI
jgi:hypothetical protein